MTAASSSFFSARRLLSDSISFLDSSLIESRDARLSEALLKLPLISVISRSTSAICELISVNELIISSLRFVAEFKFITMVFFSTCASRIALFKESFCSLSEATVFLSSEVNDLCSLSDLLTSETFFFNSSISLRLPRRLLAFLNAPPVIEPPGLSCSPSRVTILNEYLYFFAIARALSMLSTTRILPRRYFASFVYSKSTRTRLLANPITPFSCMHGSDS